MVLGFYFECTERVPMGLHPLDKHWSSNAKLDNRQLGETWSMKAFEDLIGILFEARLPVGRVAYVPASQEAMFLGR